MGASKFEAGGWSQAFCDLDVGREALLLRLLGVRHLLQFHVTALQDFDHFRIEVPPREVDDMLHGFIQGQGAAQGGGEGR